MRDEIGSAVVESIFGMFILLFLTVGTIQVALSLYARNVVSAAVHEGARAAIEVDASSGDGELVARHVIVRSAGTLIDDLDVYVRPVVSSSRYSVTLYASGTVAAPGPAPVDVPFSLQATATREIDDVGR